MVDVTPAAINCHVTAILGRKDKTEGGSGEQARVRVAWHTEPVRRRQLAKTDHKRTRIIGVPCATDGTHLHVDTAMCAEVADSPCDVNGGESDVLLYISKDVLTCNLMSSEGAACPQMVETAGIHHIHHVERAGA